MTLSVSTLVLYGLAGLVAVLAVAFVIAGTMLRPESRARLIAGVFVAYAVGWMIYALYHAAVLTELLMKMLRQS